MLTTEQLLIKRYKCIAPIPFRPAKDMYKVGDIFTDDGKTAVRNQHGDPVFAIQWEDYPHLFQPLPWWSDREPVDLPEYVKYESGKVVKVVKWLGKWCRIEGEPYSTDANFFEPATFADYEAYNQQKEGKSE